MKFFFRIIHSALLITTSTLMAYPTNEIPRLPVQEFSHQPIHIPDLRTLSYGEVVDLLERIESDSFDERYSMEELDQINQFISLLAMEGVTDDEKIEMENAVASLFRNNAVQYALLIDSRISYTAKPAIYVEGAEDFVLCKSWFKKQWDQTRAFVKEHKKAIIIGAIVVVTVAVVVVTVVAISSSAAATAAAAAGGALALADDSTGMTNGPAYSNSGNYASTNATSSSESLVASLQTEISTFRETIAQEQFAAVSEWNGISMEDNGRIMGSLFAHKVVDSMTTSFAQSPSLANELKDFGFNSQYPVPGWLQTYPNSSTIMPHPSADLAFSTDYTAPYPENFRDLNASVYQGRGDLALSSQCYTQAVQDFGNAISLDPGNPVLYLERGIANFELGNYEQSIADYNQFVEKKAEPFSVTDFSLGFAKGIPKGVYDSGEGALLFLSEFITNPVQTSKQVVDSLSQLVILVKNDEFGVVAEALSPELHQLVTHWDDLPSETRGELAGYAVGKLGTDLLAPGAVAKIASKSVSNAKELVAVCKNLQIAQEILVLETAASVSLPVKVGEIVEMGRKTINLGEELGFTAQEMGQLYKSGVLEPTIIQNYDYLNLSMKDSVTLHNNARTVLKPHSKKPMPEDKVRTLIHETGLPTFPRPKGIPENFVVMITDKGAGMEYVHPTNTHIRIRVMPGKPHSANPCQQKPYVIQKIDGMALDKAGKRISPDVPEAHIPLEEFIYRSHINGN